MYQVLLCMWTRITYFELREQSRRARSMELLFIILTVVTASLPFISVGVKSESLVVTSLPAVLFQTNGGVHNITTGSVIQLYCSVQSTTASFSWSKDERPVVIDIPHLHERTCNDSTTATSVLTVDSFQSSDSGTYRCMAVDRNSTGQGESAELRAVNSASLTVAHHPIDVDAFQDNRTGIPLISAITILSCAADYNGPSSNTPTVQLLWIRDGNIVLNNSDHSISITGLSSILEIANFAQNDAGIYQCIFNVENELITTIPLKLQTDIFSQTGINSIYLERISSEIIFLRPPEKLIIEVKATGRYRNILWSKNGFLQTVEPQQFPNYNEILVYSTTTKSDLGLYEISTWFNPILQRLVPSELDFYVIFPVDANTTITNGSDITVREGNSIPISCISTGAPTPSIFWTLNGHPVPFQPTEIVTEGQITLVRSDPNDLNSPLIPGDLNKITSNLLLMNVQYPDHDGVYNCTGSNDVSMINISSATINVQVIVPPEVEVIASSSQVVLGGSTTLFCNITRTNPGVAGAYIWRNEITGERIPENSNTTLLSLSTLNDFGVYSCMVTNIAGEDGRGNVTITQRYLDPEPVLTPPNEVESHCSHITWRNSPNVSCEDISGYDVRLFNPDTKEVVVRHVDPRGTFHNFPLLDKNLTEQKSTTVQIRIVSSTRVGTYSSPVEVGCFIPPPPSVYFELKGKRYDNNSAINIFAVGEGDNALLCKTNKQDCCGTRPNRFGEFYYPNGDQVPIRGAEQGFYRNRGDQLIQLNRRGSTSSPTGKYFCEIPDANGVTQKIIISIE